MNKATENAMSKIYKQPKISPELVKELEEDLDHIASEESQKDWNNLAFGRVYEKAFKDGANYILQALKESKEATK